MLVVVDQFTKYGHFIALRHPLSAYPIAKAYTDKVHKLHGTPKILVTNRDNIFTSLF